MNPLFFTYVTKLPPDVGFAYATPMHGAWLAGIAVFTIWFSRRYCAQTARRKRRIARRYGVLLLVLELERLVCYAYMGGLNVYELPLHLCSMALFLCAAHAFFGTDALGQILYALCLPGCIAALLFPGWNVYPMVSFVSIQCFLLHGLTVAYIVAQTCAGCMEPRLRALWKPVVFLLCIVPPIAALDGKIDANYLFVMEPSAGSPLEWLQRWLGSPGWIVGYAVLVLAVMAGMDVLWEIIHRNRQKFTHKN